MVSNIWVASHLVHIDVYHNDSNLLWYWTFSYMYLPCLAGWGHYYVVCAIWDVMMDTSGWMFCFVPNWNANCFTMVHLRMNLVYSSPVVVKFLIMTSSWESCCAPLPFVFFSSPFPVISHIYCSLGIISCCLCIPWVWQSHILKNKNFESVTSPFWCLIFFSKHWHICFPAPDSIQSCF